MKRLPYLNVHLRQINQGNHPLTVAKRRFWTLYPLAVLAIFGGFYLTYRIDRRLREASPEASQPSGASKTPSKGLSGPSYGIQADWVGTTESGEIIRETPSGIKFTW